MLSIMLILILSKEKARCHLHSYRLSFYSSPRVVLLYSSCHNAMQKYLDFPHILLNVIQYPMLIPSFQSEQKSMCSRLEIIKYSVSMSYKKSSEAFGLPRYTHTNEGTQCISYLSVRRQQNAQQTSWAPTFCEESIAHLRGVLKALPRIKGDKFDYISEKERTRYYCLISKYLCCLKSVTQHMVCKQK